MTFKRIAPEPHVLRSYLPPHLHRRLLHSDHVAFRETALETARAKAMFDVARRYTGSGLRGIGGIGFKDRSVYDMARAEFPLPGTRVLKEGDQPLVGDDDANSAFEHAGIVHDFYNQVFSRNSLDGAGIGLILSVRYGVSVSDAFWDGSQVVFGEGDGTLFLSFPRSLAVVAHELTHGVIANTSDLNYANQPGALNESFCDVMAEVLCQWHAGVECDQASWEVGGDVLGPHLVAEGVRALKTFGPSPAYVGSLTLGDDTQPKRMSDFLHTGEDYGGVHSNAGIPNHAFYLAATRLGGRSWDSAGRIWFDAFLKLDRHSDFSAAAAATARQAELLFGAHARDVVRGAWADVGVN